MNQNQFMGTFVAAILAPTIVWAALTPLGSEFQVNTTAGSSYFGSPAVAVDAQGGSVVVWANVTDLDGVLGQRFDSAGAPLGTEFRVSSDAITAGPAVALAPAGDFFVVWGSDNRVLGRRYDSTGAALGGPFEVSSDSDVSARPAVAVDSAGGFIVVWDGADFISPSQLGARGVFAQRYDRAGNLLGAAIQVNDDPVADTAWPRVLAEVHGDFLVTWRQPPPEGIGDPTGFDDIVFRRYDAAGMPLGTAVRVNPAGFAAVPDLAPALAAHRSGGFVIAWWGLSASPPFLALYAQRYDDAGRTSGTGIRAADGPGLAFCGFYAPGLATDPYGGFAIVSTVSCWSGSEADSPSKVYARRYDLTGAPLGGEWTVVNSSCYANEPAAAADSNGVLTLVWSDSKDILARRYRMPPTTAGETCTGDCDCNRSVAIDELVTGVGIALRGRYARFGACTAFDANADGQVTIDEVVSAVQHALSGCPGE